MAEFENTGIGEAAVPAAAAVAEAPAQAAKKPDPIESDDDPRIGKQSAWQTTGTLFTNRVRAEIDDGDTIFYLPNGFVLRGAEVKDTQWLAVWLEGRRGYLSRNLARRRPDRPVPSKMTHAPDPAIGFRASARPFLILWSATAAGR